MPDDLLRKSIDILKRRKVRFADEFAPYFVCSIGVHLFNLSNRRRIIYREYGAIRNMRLHILFVAPPGFSKTFLSEQLAHETHGLFSNITDDDGNLLLKTGFEGYMTEAGWIGSLEPNPKNPKQPHVTYGMAHEYKDGIVCIDEFSAISAAIKQQHSAALDPALLSSLDTGRVRKRLKAGPLQYETNVTAWFGTQQSRFDLSSGLGRRLFFILWVPTESDQEELVQAHWEGKNISTPVSRLVDLKDTAAETIERVDTINRVEFSMDYRDGISSLNRPHHELTLYDRLAIGYHIMTGKFDRNLYIDVDEYLMDLIVNGMEWRQRLMSESEGDQILQILEEAGGSLDEASIKLRMTKFGVTHTHCNDLLQKLQYSHRIKIKRINNIRTVVRRK